MTLNLTYYVLQGFRFEETLTGFKWLGNRAIQLREEGYTVLFAYEEAIGFCIGDVVNDKDGVVAASVFTEMAKQLHKNYSGDGSVGCVRSVRFADPHHLNIKHVFI